MSFEVVSTVDHLRLTVSGEYSFNKILGFIDFVKPEADSTGRKKVLVNCSRLEGSLTEADRFQSGKRLAESSVRASGPQSSCQSAR